MSDHTSDLAERDLAGAPSVTLDEARAMPLRRWQSDGLIRSPSEPDEAGALCVRIPLFSTERVAYFEQSGRARLVFLDRAAQPRAHVPDAEGRQAAPPRQATQVRQGQPGDAGPLFGGSPGCAAPSCAPAPAPLVQVALLCTKCGKPPPGGVSAIEGGTHYLIRHRNDASRPRVDFKRTHTCGKWRRAG